MRGSQLVPQKSARSRRLPRPPLRSGGQKRGRSAFGAGLRRTTARRRTQPDAQMLRSEDVNLVHKALALLSEDHRSILVLREMEDMAYEEIAEVLQISIGTVRSRLNRARFALKQQLEKYPQWNPEA